jgi:hypothetical protein
MIVVFASLEIPAKRAIPAMEIPANKFAFKEA